MLQVADMVCERTRIMKWLLSRVRQREVDSVKHYASEVLAILVQNSTANRKRLVDGNGIDTLLQVCSATACQTLQRPLSACFRCACHAAGQSMLCVCGLGTCSPAHGPSLTPEVQGAAPEQDQHTQQAAALCLLMQ